MIHMQIFTLEVRWFFEGFPDKGFTDWFNHGNPILWDIIEDRTDIYLVVPGSNDMGIKFRGDEKFFEIKGRRSIIGIQEFTPTVFGVMERWIKWSYDVSQSVEWIDGILRFATGQVRVTKQRFQRKFSFNKDNEFCEIGLQEQADRGAYAEVTQLIARNNNYWTLGFEALPDYSISSESFIKVVSMTLKDSPLPMDLKQSLSYPAWLAHFEAVK